MRIDSCRKCGKTLELKKNCQVCNKPLKFECSECRIESEEQIHSLCRLVDMNYNQLAPKTA